MAITVISNFTSNKFYPSSNPINCTVTSNNNGKCNFRYICDLYILGTKVFTVKLFPDPNTGYGFFQLSRVIQDYIKTSIPKTSYTNVINNGAATTTPSANLTVFCRFGEEYDNSTTCDGTIVQYNSLVTSNTFYVFEAAIDYEEFPTFSYTDYLIGTQSASTKFLTNSPREITVTYNDSYFLDFISLQTINGSYSVQVKGYNPNGSTSFQNTYSSILTSTKRYRLAVGPFDINYEDTAPTINPNIPKYDVWLQRGSTIVSEVFTFIVKPPKTFQTRISFIGLLGGIESFTFYHRNVAQYNIEKRTFNKLLQSNYSGQWKYEVGDRGMTTYKINAKESHKVSSYCDKDTSEWLYEMWLSPEAFTYQRPNLYEFRPFQDGIYVKFWVNGDHGLKAGDSILTFTTNGDYSDYFTVVSVSGNIVDLGLLYSIYGATMEGTCGFVQKYTSWSVLPIVISDNVAEVKQKTSKPIEYSLNYEMAYSKTTLRG